MGIRIPGSGPLPAPCLDYRSLYCQQDVSAELRKSYQLQNIIVLTPICKYLILVSNPWEILYIYNINLGLTDVFVHLAHMNDTKHMGRYRGWKFIVLNKEGSLGYR